MNNLKKIAVFLDGNYSVAGGMARTALMLCNALLESDEQVTVVFGANIDHQSANSLITPQLRSRFSITDLSWAEKLQMFGPKWIRPHSINGYDFGDCDLWVFFHFPLNGVITPLKPIAAFCPDLLMRVVPEAIELSPNQEHRIWGNLINCFLSYRQADLVFSTTPRTLEDVISYAGVAKKNTCLAPQFPPSDTENYIFGKNPSPWKEYFLWTSNDTPHKNHERAFQILDRYYAASTTKTLPVILTGGGTEYFNPNGPSTGHSYHLAIRRFLVARPHILKNIYFAGSLCRPEFNAVMKDAKFLWHNVIYDNGTASVLEAAEYGVPSLISDYPQSRFFDKKYSTRATFFSPFNLDDGLKKLQLMSSLEDKTRPGSITIDHTCENRLFSAWISHFLSFFNNLPTQKEKSHGSLNISRQNPIPNIANYGARSIRKYLLDFPFTETINIGLILAELDKNAAVTILEQFSLSIRQDYKSFKLIILIDAPQDVINAVQDYIKYNALGFDFITLTNRHRSIAFRLIDHYCFRIYTNKSISTVTDTDRLKSIQNVKSLRDEILTCLSSSLSLDLQNADVFSSTKNSKIRPTPLVIPCIPKPRHSVQFWRDDCRRYVISGLYPRERRGFFLGYRWATNDVRLTLPKIRASRKYIYILANTNIRCLTDSQATPSIEIFINSRYSGIFKLRPGINLYLLRLASLDEPPSQFNEIRLRSNYSFNASEENPMDTREISWQAYAIGFSSGFQNVLMLTIPTVISVYLHIYDLIKRRAKSITGLKKAIIQERQT